MLVFSLTVMKQSTFPPLNWSIIISINRSACLSLSFFREAARRADMLQFNLCMLNLYPVCAPSFGSFNKIFLFLWLKLVFRSAAADALLRNRRACYIWGHSSWAMASDVIITCNTTISHTSDLCAPQSIAPTVAHDYMWFWHTPRMLFVVRQRYDISPYTCIFGLCEDIFSLVLSGWVV